MSAVSLPVTRTNGRALLVGNPTSRGPLLHQLQELGYQCGEVDDPYNAMAQLCQSGSEFRAVFLSLASLYREELAIISAIKRHKSGIEIWLAHTDGRPAALAEGMRLGADGLLAEDGLHRVAMGAPPAPSPSSTAAEPPHPLPATATVELDAPGAEPVLSAEELRALLHEPSTMPPAGERD